MKKILILTCMVLFPFFSFCGTPANPGPRTKALSDGQQKSLNAASNDFAFRLLQQVDRNAEGDWFVSPVSLEYLLGMVLDGARGKTADDIARTLGLDPASADSLDLWSREMLDRLPKLDPATKLTLGNAIFINQIYPVQKAYKDRVVKMYDAEVENLDFGNEKATLRRINGWCDKQTNGLIPQVLNDVNPDMFAYLLNALYFKGTWMHKFNSRYTEDRPFRLESGQEKMVPMMMQERKFDYSENELCQRLRLPYGDGSFAMVVMLPKKGHKVAEVVASLDAEGWETIRHRMYGNTRINVWLPRFESKYHIKLNDILSDMGMARAFRSGADFKAMSLNADYLDFVQQDAVIKVDEEGSEAAAVSVGGMMGATAVPEPPRVIDFHADHPFLYLIVESRTGTVLFAGEYTGK